MIVPFWADAKNCAVRRLILLVFRCNYIHPVVSATIYCTGVAYAIAFPIYPRCRNTGPEGKVVMTHTVVGRTLVKKPLYNMA